MSSLTATSTYIKEIRMNSGETEVSYFIPIRRKYERTILSNMLWNIPFQSLHLEPQSLDIWQEKSRALFAICTAQTGVYVIDLAQDLVHFDLVHQQFVVVVLLGLAELFQTVVKVWCPRQ